MTLLAWILICAPVLLVAYAYAGYPLLLWLLAHLRRPAAPPAPPAQWPSISICVPVYNEEAQIRGLIESLLALDYPPEKRQILVVSDASTDGTDAIVEEYAPAGVELLRLPERSGKTAAETAAAAHLRGEIIVNTDASIRIRPDALKPLIARFADPAVGVASGRDVSIARHADDPNIGEAGYVGYEMAVRALETRLGGIIGASGCFYAIRPELYRAAVPAHLSRDFASALIAREHGYRAVSVDEAVCFVPRTGSLQREYYRKVRTLSRGMETLLHKRHLLNPLRYGAFAWKLWSHKVCRWLAPCGLALALPGLTLLAPTAPWADWALGAAALGAALAWLGWRWPDRRPMPRILAMPTSIAVVTLAALHSLYRALRGNRDATWEPTRRDVIHPPVPAGGLRE
ncbi:MAG TPA: glycosyltransferase [Longimicrobiales bacterium]